MIYLACLELKEIKPSSLTLSTVKLTQPYCTGCVTYSLAQQQVFGWSVQVFFTSVLPRKTYNTLIIEKLMIQFLII